MEWNFQKIVMVFAIIVLIIILILVGFALSKSKKEATWPPIVSNCPDYWMDLSGNGTACFNEQGLGTCNIPSDDDKNVMNFNVSPYNTAEGGCAKYNWAKNCGVSWDGVTYGSSNPCVKKAV